MPSSELFEEERSGVTPLLDLASDEPAEVVGLQEAERICACGIRASRHETVAHAGIPGSKKDQFQRQTGFKRAADQIAVFG
jgi:hypothetical protein